MIGEQNKMMSPPEPTMKMIVPASTTPTQPGDSVHLLLTKDPAQVLSSYLPAALQGNPYFEVFSFQCGKGPVAFRIILITTHVPLSGRIRVELGGDSARDGKGRGESRNGHGETSSPGGGRCGVSLFRRLPIPTQPFGLLRHALAAQVTMEITSKDRAYPWVLGWLTRQASASRLNGAFGSTLAQHVSVVTSVAGDDDGTGLGGGKGLGGGRSEAGEEVQFEFAPSVGRHFVAYGNSMLMVQRTR